VDIASDGGGERGRGRTLLHSSVAQLAIECPCAQGNVAGRCSFVFNVRSIRHSLLGWPVSRAASCLLVVGSHGRRFGRLHTCPA
jgi:hypothetical protein